jgi:hypothetical protein
LLYFGDGTLDRADRGSTAARDLYDVSAAIGGIAAPLHEPAVFQVVENCHECAGVGS